VERDLSQEPSGADERRSLASQGGRWSWSIVGRRLSILPLAGLSVIFGASVAVAAALRSGAFAGGIPPWDGEPGYWPASVGLLGLVSAAWLAGAILVCRMIAGLGHWSRNNAPFSPPWIGMLAAFGVGPLLLVLFFALIGLAADLVANPFAAIVATAAALVPFTWGRSAFVRLAGELLVSLFVWLALLVLPAFWDDPVSRLFARILIDLLNLAGLLP
jgi:hypothetical protein